MTTATELRALTEAITAGPVTRELEDRVLLACTKWHFETDGQPVSDERGLSYLWWNPEGGYMGMSRPSPLSDLQDAKLAVPEFWSWNVGTNGDPDEPMFLGTCRGPKDQELSHGQFECGTANDPAQALTLAGLYAMLAELEQNDDG